ncbi:3-deoxy-D-manno-octulosonic acid transferase [Hymenobacter glacialis]|uniref:3-deoxy-D-manno-octulosonic acid transferase n=1 Tax=Hymenobacter glacialis TaxID=1908236 RepID=A0A1G1T5J4_9BACT|nr:glycosyltransferase N-terminal domain-containing protein [Hymenobacter glacialis]OGX86145.1 3-deoxy-D-manno-octulosonic acid transferase [Hymenobacter glacialis]
MLFFYNIALGLYGLQLRLVAPFVPKAAAWVAGRKGLLAHIRNSIGADAAPRVWFHCASLGEFEQGRPLLEAYRLAHPGTKLVLTFYSPSGYEIRKSWPGADYVFYLPLDTESNAKAFFDVVRPRLVVFVKYEFWYHFLNQAHERGIPSVVVSAIFRPDQVFFKPWGGFFKGILKRFAHIFTQNDASAQLLRAAGIRQVSVAGDTRFDTVVGTAAASPRSLPLVNAFVADGAPVLVVGSSWPEDLPVLAPLILRYGPELRVLVAPHEITETNLRLVEAAFPGLVQRYSHADAATVGQARILLFDNIGLLSQLYRFGKYAYIGGAFGKGLHNTLEAAAFGLPLFFGPTYAKFQEAVELVALKCAFPVASAADLETTFTYLWHHEEARLRLQDAMLDYVHGQAGATRTIMAALPGLTAS